MKTLQFPKKMNNNVKYMDKVDVVASRITECTKTIVSIPLYNESQNLERQLFAFSEQSNEHTLYSFVNNGSTDGTLDKLQGMLAKCNFDYVIFDLITRIRCCGTPRKMGFEKPMEMFELSPTFLFSFDGNSFPAEDALYIGKRILSESADFLSFPIQYDRQFINCLASFDSKCGEFMEMIVNQEENLQDIQKDFGLIKLRGKGFGILTECYKKVGGHHQPMTTEGYPLKGESYQLGKKLIDFGFRGAFADSYVTVSPRRFLGNIVLQNNPYLLTKEGICYIPARYTTDDIPRNIDWHKQKLARNINYFAKLYKLLLNQSLNKAQNIEILKCIYGDRSVAIADRLEIDFEELDYEFSGQIDSLIDFSMLYREIVTNES